MAPAMLKIEAVVEPPSRVRLRLAGDLSADHLPELRRLIAEARGAGREVTLDLDAIKLIDRDAIVFFASPEGRKARLEGCPSYAVEWIRCETAKERPQG